MGFHHTLGAVYEVARVTLPTFVDVLTGRVTRDRIDARCRQFSRNVLDRARVALEVVGADAVPADRAMIYMSNHQSHVDIPVLFCTVPARTIRMIAKTELYRIPIWGQALRGAGFVEIDRSDHRRAIASMERAGEQIASGISVWVAPEGSRSPDGSLRPLKKGGFHLAKNTGTPIVPVAIQGTRAVMPKGSMSMRTDQRVRVTFGAPIEVGDRSIDDLIAVVEGFFREHV
jgi:1-acyl-sn-glycerol-3-phosphate acyltransferase